MKRIKTSNILIITIIILIFGYGLYLILAAYNIARKLKDQENAGTNILTVTNSIDLPEFNTIVVNGKYSVQITYDKSFRMSTPSQATFRVKNDTLWLNCSAIIGAPEIKTVIAANKAVINMELPEQKTLSLFGDDNALLIIKDSKITNLNVHLKDKAKLVIGETDICRLNLQMKNKATAKLIANIDTLTGQTGRQTHLTVSKVKVKKISVQGTETEVFTNTSGFQFKIEKE